ncbi:MAG: hypothetical protein QOH49_2318 [Acidobacteriota bacterium]|nr:hypothetical protein [Acidobacteriota bacterium]
MLPHELLRVSDRRQVPEARLPPLPIVEEVDVLGDLTRGLGASSIPTVVHQLYLVLVQTLSPAEYEARYAARTLPRAA